MDIKQIILNKIIKQTKIKCCGVKPERRMPPEFIITEHAEERSDYRLELFGSKLNEVIIRAWYSKKVIPSTFNKEKAKQRNDKKVMKLKGCDRIVYKYYRGRIFVFGMRFNNTIKNYQKILITVYEWNK